MISMSDLIGFVERWVPEYLGRQNVVPENAVRAGDSGSLLYSTNNESRWGVASEHSHAFTALNDVVNTWGPAARMQGIHIIPEGTPPSANGSGSMTIPQSIVMNPISGSWFRIAAGTYALTSWGYLYVDLPPTTARGSTVTPTVAAWADGDRAYDHADRLILAQRSGPGPIRLSPLWTVPANPNGRMVGRTERTTLFSQAVATGNTKTAVIHSLTVEGDGVTGMELHAEGYYMNAKAACQLQFRIEDGTTLIGLTQAHLAGSDQTRAASITTYVAPFTGSKTFNTVLLPSVATTVELAGALSSPSFLRAVWT